MNDRPADLVTVDDWSEVPAFADEREEAEFWQTHSLGRPLLDRLGTEDDPDLPCPRLRGGRA